MPDQKDDGTFPKILYACYDVRSRDGEQFVPEHIFSYQIAGTSTLSDGQHSFTFGEGSFKLIKRNQLVKFSKQPPPAGEFQSLSVYLDQETLRRFSIEYGYSTEKPQDSRGIIPLPTNGLFTSYIESLKPYQQLQQPGNEPLLALKLREAILILLKTTPDLANVLFDFSEPGKIDLEAFMNRNYQFNVELKRFAYLSGRSLATFKRDFEKIFHQSPSHWLVHRRLQEAYYLIKEKGKAPSDVYLDLGFENLSHFSYAFRKTYGMSPSRVNRMG